MCSMIFPAPQTTVGFFGGRDTRVGVPLVAMANVHVRCWHSSVQVVCESCASGNSPHVYRVYTRPSQYFPRCLRV